MKGVREVDFVVRNNASLPDSVQLAIPAVIHHQGENCDCSYAAIAHARSILLTETGKICEEKVKSAEFAYTYLRHFINHEKPCCKEFPSCCPSKISDGLRLVRQNGIVRAQQWPNDLRCCIRKDTSGAQFYRIENFSRIRKTSNIKVNILNLKSALANRNPIIVGLYAPESLRKNNKGKGYWQYSKDEKNFCYHAFVITGYSPGYFNLLNSYGSSWGVNGSVWITTQEFMKLYMKEGGIGFIMDWHCP